MTQQGYVNLTVVDNGGAVVVVPQSSVQLVLAPASGGTPNQVVSTRSIATLQSTFVGGPLVEYSAMAINGGGSILAVATTINTHGYAVGGAAAALTVTTATDATPIVVTTSASHNLLTGHVVTVAGVSTNTAANGTWVITVLSSTTFSLNGTTGNGSGSGGTAQPTGVLYIGTGTLVPTLTLDSSIGAYDDLYVQMTFVTGGTIGTAGITFTISLDANRNTGPTIALGTATSYTIPGTGITIDLTSTETVVAGDYIRTATAMPEWNTAGIQTALNAVQASPYASTGWGSTMICGVMSGAHATTIGGYPNSYLETLANGFLYTRALCAARDVAVPQAWGGATAPETESTWMTSILTDFSAVSAKRICANGGFYNMPSQIPNSAAGAPAYRRSLAWALGVRQVAIPPQRHAGRVRDGSLSSIVVSPTTDPFDGFVYHDERLNPGLSAGRFSSATTRIPNTPGYFILQPNLMSPQGSQYGILPFGLVIDVGSSIVVQEANQIINEDVRTNADGTIYVNDALAIQNAIMKPIRANMINAKMISGAAVVVDQTTDVQDTSTVDIATTFDARGYIETIDATIGYATTT